jgi:transcription antitermination factor NusG
VVKDKEIEDIRRFLNEYEDVQLQALDFQPQTKVLIRSGIFMDKEAVVQRVMHHTVEVVIESLGYKLVAKLEKTNLISIT